VAFSPDGTRLAALCRSGDLIIWDAATGRRAASVSPDIGSGARLAFSPDGRKVAVCGAGLEVWDVAGARRLQKVERHTGAVYDVAYSPDGRWLASGGNDRTIRL
jgi:WD40 repeat protein